MLYDDGGYQVAKTEVVLPVDGFGISDGAVVALQQFDASVRYEDGGATKEISAWREGEVEFRRVCCTL